MSKINMSLTKMDMESGKWIWRVKTVLGLTQTFLARILCEVKCKLVKILKFPLVF